MGRVGASESTKEAPLVAKRQCLDVPVTGWFIADTLTVTWMNRETKPEGRPWLATHRLKDGRVVRFRHSDANDVTAVRVAMKTSSEETLRQRFFAIIRDLGDAELQGYLQIDRRKGLCVVGVLECEAGERLVCGIRYIRMAIPEVAEIALTVHDDVRRQGLGLALLQIAESLALADGIQHWIAHVLPSNEAMLSLLARIHPNLLRSWEENLMRIQIPLREMRIDRVS